MGTGRSSEHSSHCSWHMYIWPSAITVSWSRSMFGRKATWLSEARGAESVTIYQQGKALVFTHHTQFPFALSSSNSGIVCQTSWPSIETIGRVVSHRDPNIQRCITATTNYKALSPYPHSATFK